jgi:hypothetical protein
VRGKGIKEISLLLNDEIMLKKRIAIVIVNNVSTLILNASEPFEPNHFCKKLIKNDKFPVGRAEIALAISAFFSLITVPSDGTSSKQIRCIVMLLNIISSFDLIY